MIHSLQQSQPKLTRTRTTITHQNSRANLFIIIIVIVIVIVIIIIIFNNSNIFNIMIASDISASKMLVMVLAVSSCLHQANSAPSTHEARVIGGGKPADPGEYPFLVGLAHNDKHLCGGSIMDEYHILTAAHCLTGNPALSKIDVRVGCHSRFDCAKIPVAGYLLHGLHDGNRMANDIALIKTSAPIPLNSIRGPGAIRAIELPANNNKVYEEGDKLTVAGWGRIACNSTKLPDVPMKAQLSALSLERCKAMQPCKFYSIDERNICTSSTKRLPYRGDSGGPLIDTNDDGKFILAGIVSWGNSNCTDPRRNDVYTRVSSFLDWIKETKIKMSTK
uniref:Mite allergen Der p 3 n=1 Tax=Aceria tosichella TaxID=561515 RepID=A0A6G1S4C0_9ACAR